MSNFEPTILRQLAEKYYQSPCIKMEKIPQSGSVRIYCRLLFDGKPSLMGVYNEDVAENHAFFAYTRFFKKQGVNVPQLFDIHENEQYYLLSDLGDETLYSFLLQHRDGQSLAPEVIKYYQKVIRQLPMIQMTGKQGLDFSVAYPRQAFDRQSMQWDLNYFKYYFVKLSKITFDEQKLENDFQTLMDKLLQCDSDFFLYRDFQSRNIMIHDG